MKETWQGTLKNKLVTQYVQKTHDWVDVNISTSGLLNLTIVSDFFVDTSAPQRRESVLNFLQQSQVAVSPGFLLQEAESLNLSPSPAINGGSIHTWQDVALQAANPQNQSPLPQREPSVPRTVTFYSFKGGVGRTTALTHVAWILAMRGRKVVTVDLDLEAPGIQQTAKIWNWQFTEGVEPTISVKFLVKSEYLTGRLFVVPAGTLNLTTSLKLMI